MVCSRPNVIDAIIEAAPVALLEFQAAQAALPVTERTPIGDWLRDFQRAAQALRDPAQALRDPAGLAPDSHGAYHAAL